MGRRGEAAGVDSTECSTGAPLSSVAGRGLLTQGFILRLLGAAARAAAEPGRGGSLHKVCLSTPERFEDENLVQSNTSRNLYLISHQSQAPGPAWKLEIRHQRFPPIGVLHCHHDCAQSEGLGFVLVWNLGIFQGRYSQSHPSDGISG